MPVGETLDLIPGIMGGLNAFLAAFPAESPEWPAIRQSLDNSGIRMTSSDLIGIMKTYFQRLPTQIPQ